MRGKQGGKQNFLLSGLGEKTRKTENGVKNNPFRPTFFCPPNLGRKLRRKDEVGSKLHKYPHLQGMFGWGENREDGKEGEKNMVENRISLVWSRRENKRDRK